MNAQGDTMAYNYNSGSKATGYARNSLGDKELIPPSAGSTF
jgi:hypothetical protein